MTLDQDEIAAAAGDRAHVIKAELFVDADALDPVFYEKTYYLGAGKDGADAYRLLHDALGEAGRTGFGRFTFPHTPPPTLSGRVACSSCV